MNCLLIFNNWSLTLFSFIFLNFMLIILSYIFMLYHSKE